MGRHAVANHSSAEGLDRREERVRRVRGAATGSQDHVDASRAARDRRERPAHRLVLVHDVIDGTDSRPEALDLVPDAPLEARPVRRPQRLLDDDRDRHRPERRDTDQRAPAVARDPRTGGNHRGGQYVRRDLDAGDEVVLGDDRAVQAGEDLEGIEAVQPFEITRSDVDDAVVGRDQIDTALDGPARGEALPRHDRGEPERSLVLVEIAVLRDDDGDAVINAPRRRCHEGVQVGRRQPPALRPAGAAHDEVTRKHRPDKIRRRAPASRQSLETHAPLRS
jgi:hypothetical protein